MKITNYKSPITNNAQFQNPNDRSILVVGIWIAILLSLIFQGCAYQSQVCFEQTCFQVEVVQTEEDVQKGLMFRSALEENSGMLFIFKDNRRHSFWMKNTLISLDMIWMDHTRKIIHIEENVPPCKADPCPTYTPAESASYVLEVNAGRVAKDGIQLGNVAQFKLK